MRNYCILTRCPQTQKVPASQATRVDNGRTRVHRRINQEMRGFHTEWGTLHKCKQPPQNPCGAPPHPVATAQCRRRGATKQKKASRAMPHRIGHTSTLSSTCSNPVGCAVRRASMRRPGTQHATRHSAPPRHQAAAGALCAWQGRLRRSPACGHAPGPPQPRTTCRCQA